MAKKTKKNVSNLHNEGGGSDDLEVHGASMSFEELTIEDFMNANLVPKESISPEWKTTRYPVSKNEFKKLCELAMKPQRATRGLFEDPSAGDVDEGVDEDSEVMFDDLDYPEDLPEDDESAPGSGMPSSFAPNQHHSFDGPGQGGWSPPDCAIGVGKNDVLTGVNVESIGYRKNGTQRFRWPSFNKLFSRVLPSGATLFDPQIAYDHYENRWIAVVAARRNSPRGSWAMVAVSKGEDPKGGWWIWALDASKDGGTATNNWMDYPQLGFDAQAIYIGMNQFEFGGSFKYAKVRILNKAELYRGGVGSSHNVKWYDFWNLKNPNGTQAFTVLPCRHYRGKYGNPAGYCVNALWPKGNSLTMWKITDPLALWKGRKPKIYKYKVACQAYDLPPDAIQKGSSNRIQTNDSRLMNAIFQHAGGVQRIWTCHTDRKTWSGEREARSVIQWYEIDAPTKKVYQQNSYGAKGRYYYFPVIQTDLRRNAYLAFSRSGSTEYVSLRRTGRKVSAAKHRLEGSARVKAGEGPYSGNRWGDYFGITRDGADKNRVWALGEYADARNRWGTWVFSMKY